jgi:hypothetical protein
MRQMRASSGRAIMHNCAAWSTATFNGQNSGAAAEGGNELAAGWLTISVPAAFGD